MSFFIFTLQVQLKPFLIILHNWGLHRRMESILILNEESCYYFSNEATVLYPAVIILLFLYFSINLRDHLIFFYDLDLKLDEVILFQLETTSKLDYCSSFLSAKDL